MKTYLLVNIFIILVPLLLSFERKIKFFKKLLPVSISIIFVGAIYIVWDIIAVNRGDWSFNRDYVSGSYIINLPFEEILFFITVPYSILFIYECLKFYIKDKYYSVNKYIISTAALVFFILGVLFYNMHYTSTVFIFCSIIFLLLIFFSRPLIVSKSFFLVLLISILPFLIVNYILTSLPVVTYNDSAILGIKLLTIPVEDFFYSSFNDSMLAYSLRFSRKRKIEIENKI